MPMRTETPRTRKKMRRWYMDCAAYVDGEPDSLHNEESVYSQVKEEGNRIYGETEVILRSVRGRNSIKENRRNLEDISFALNMLEEHHKKNLQAVQ